MSATAQTSQELYQEKLRKVVYLCFKKTDEIRAGNSDMFISFYRYNETKFKSDMEYFSNALCDKARKFSLIGKPPAKLPEAMTLAETMELVVRTMTILVLTIPDTRGKVLKEEIVQTSIDLIKGIASLVNSFLEEPVDSDVYLEYFFASPTSIFESADRLKKMSTNNAVSIQKRWEEHLDLLQDVINEVEDLQEDNGLFDFDDSVFEMETNLKNCKLSDEEKAMMKRCLALVKVTRILFRKILVRCIKPCDPQTVEVVNWLDQLYFTSQSVLSSIDDLGVSLHGPENCQLISLHASRLTRVAVELIEIAKLYATAEHVPWFERCAEQYNRILVSIHERNPQR